MLIRSLLLALFALTLLSLPSACNQQSAATDTEAGDSAKSAVAGTSASKTGGTTEVVMLNDDNFKKVVLDADRLVVVDFYADWCKPCRALAPHIKSLAKENKGEILFGKLNTDHSGRTSGEYSVRALPTLVFFKNGKPVDRIVGLYGKDFIQAKIDELAK